MTKLLENTFRAVNIALANEFAEICQVMDMEVMDVIDAAATKPYGFMPFYPGPGVGGHCIPCDPQYLLWQLRRERLSTPVIEQAMAGDRRAPASSRRPDPGDAVSERGPGWPAHAYWSSAWPTSPMSRTCGSPPRWRCWPS